MNSSLPTLICSSNSSAALQLDPQGSIMVSNAMPSRSNLFVRTKEGDFLVHSRDDMHYYYRVILLGLLFKLNVPRIEGFYLDI